MMEAFQKFIPYFESAEKQLVGTPSTQKLDEDEDSAPQPFKQLKKLAKRLIKLKKICKNDAIKDVLP